MTDDKPELDASGIDLTEEDLRQQREAMDELLGGEREVEHELEGFSDVSVRKMLSYNEEREMIEPNGEEGGFIEELNTEIWCLCGEDFSGDSESAIEHIQGVREQ